ncbi:peptide ABC transporter [Brevibacillus reuszeri]|uniref:Peptide ABC transporter n=1 Tax=Brevibacillus reuszeri TaxID=54915 RepID=A0A0K9YMN9_9BACL|nr:ATP-binding cassette domain-containing protein [Brevibacillus reuszeri]KNB69984.1 peptide ABC transporter [Brevibacillus reuszeri]MED1858351.1 ATP-binding cassette domain-containing protein [Brevibacillus reuszeri]GED68649.1 peptide ABC transporter [Brevibacillus reuszeri]
MLLEAKQIGFRYERDRPVLRGVDISIQSGEIVGLVGPSGFGKSTLSRILAGYEQPHEGQVLLDGAPLPASGFHPVQLVFQHPEKAVNPRWRMSRTLAEAGDLDASLLERLGVQKEWLERFPNELSGGELQRFCVARALGRGTRFLLADEMTAMLDAITQAQIWQVVLEVARKENMGVLVISHEKHLIHRLCTRVVDLTITHEKT